MSATDFDAAAKEQQLRSESDDALEKVANQLREACEQVGFFSIVGHKVPNLSIKSAFDQTREFHGQTLDSKRQILMDRPDWPTGGMGYLPLKNKKLPARDTGNVNEAFIVKCDDKLTMNDNQWPDSKDLPQFRATVENYASEMVALGKRLLPVYATALDMPEDFFNKAFDSPLYRLRMTHYPAVERDPENAFGIAPHVDTSFCTILAQDQPGLTIFSERRKVWINAPLIADAFIVNTGELLKHWTNDRFLSTRHFANNNTGKSSRYSLPFFFNANPHYRMECIPTCCSEDKPAKYAPISYAESQGVVQGE